MEDESHGAGAGAGDDSTIDLSLSIDLQELAAPRDAFMSASPEPLSSPSSEYERQLDAKLPPKQRVSIYVQVFEEMIHTVMEHESFLFNDEEKDLIARFAQMSYEARYLFVRLFSRKNGWFRVAKLAYCDEIANMQRTVEELCLAPGQSPPPPEDYRDTPTPMPLEAGPSRLTSQAPSEYILIDDDEDEEAEGKDDEIKRDDGNDTSAEASTSANVSLIAEEPIDPLVNRTIEEIEKDKQDFGLSRFAINEKILAERADVDELLSMLSLDELKALGKELRVSNKATTRSALIQAIKFNASNQSTLTSMFAAGQAKAEAKKAAMRARKGKGRALDVGPAGDMSGRQSPPATSQTQLVIKKILKHLGHCIKLESAPIRLFARLHLLYYRSVSYSEKTLTQAVLSRFKIRNYPSYAVKRSFTIFADRQTLLDYEEALILERRMEEFLGEALDPSSRGSTRKFTKEDRERGLREGLKLFEECYPRWQALVKEAQAKDADLEEKKPVLDEDGNPQEPADDRLTYYRKRFLAGWPLTRVVWKGTTILARLHEYDREASILRDLLNQSCFRRGKRGEWYDRLALVTMHHLKGDDKDVLREQALALCKEGLSHPWTHLIYHNSLARRIVRLESALGLPSEERHPPVPGLRAAKKRIMKGEKMSEGETGKKSSWRAIDGAEISVEALSLECYNREGWKGFHSENGILTTIFTLLFWDVIFAPIDGVFETAYQSGPLDLSTDAFSIVRSELVQERLQAIEDGRALELLRTTDERERENKTWCVGVRWAYEREDLLEIVQCLSPKALVTICRVYAEEWSHRIGGVPDLFLWNFEKRACRFVEVKGPGDILSETQKVWIDVLLSAGVEVELCSVKQIFEEDELDLSDDEPALKRKRSTPAKTKKRQAKGESPDDSEDSERDEESRPANRGKASKKAKAASKDRDENEEEKENLPENLSKKGAKTGDPAEKSMKTDKKRTKVAKKRQGIVTSGQTIVLSD